MVFINRVCGVSSSMVQLGSSSAIWVRMCFQSARPVTGLPFEVQQFFFTTHIEGSRSSLNKPRHKHYTAAHQLKVPAPHGDGHPQPPNWEECRRPLLGCISDPTRFLGLHKTRLLPTSFATPALPVCGAILVPVLTVPSRVDPPGG